MKRTSSDVWQFFDRLAEDKRCVAVICKLCSNQYKYFGNTTNLRAHVKKKHPLQWDLRDITMDKEKTDVEPSINDGTMSTHQVDQDIDAAHIDMSDEEWLEDVYLTTADDYEPKKKLKKVNMQNIFKRELSSPSPTYSPIASESVPLKTGQYIIEEPLRDEYSVFGEYIANKLRSLKTSGTRGNVQQLVSTILWQAECGIFDDIEAVKKMMMSAATMQPPNSSRQDKASWGSQGGPKITFEMLKPLNPNNDAYQNVE